MEVIFQKNSAIFLESPFFYFLWKPEIIKSNNREWFSGYKTQ